MIEATSLNKVFEGLEPSPTLFVNETIAKLWSEGKTVYHMGFGEARLNVHPKLNLALKENSDKKFYLPARGLPELCERVASFYSRKLELDFDEKQVIIGPGSKALIFAIQMALSADLFLPTPSWVSYEPQAKLLGLKTRYIPASFKNSYRLDIDELDKQVSKSDNPNKLLIINSPNNPSGQMLSESELKEIAKYCLENNIIVISDEIYSFIAHSPNKHQSIASYYPEGTIILGGISKHLSLGGWRLGVSLVPDNKFGENLMQALVVIASEIWSAVSAPVQFACVKAYSNDSELEKIVIDTANIHRIRSNFIFEKLNELGVETTKPQGGFYLTANLDSWKEPLAKKGVQTSEDLAKYLLEIHSIATLPGSGFGIPTDELALRLSTSFLDFESKEAPDRLLSLYQSGVSEDEFMSETNHPNTHGALKAFSEFIASLN